jgi:Na+-transporting NADH:ubiquinone oxidoreductase subunit NqrB
MASDDQTDALLASLLAAPERAPDERFVLQVRQAMIADRALVAARKSAWRKFGVEMAATGAVVLAFLLLNRSGSALPDDAAIPLYNPAMIGFLLLALWALVAMRPAAAEE